MSSIPIDFIFVGLLLISTFHILAKACISVAPEPQTSTSSSSSTSIQTTTTTRLPDPCTFSSSLGIRKFMNFNGTCSNGQCVVSSGSSFSVQGSICGNDGLQISTVAQSNQQVIAPGVILFTCTDGALAPGENSIKIVGTDATTINCYPTCSVLCDVASGTCPFQFQGQNDATCSGNRCTITDGGTTRIILGRPSSVPPLCLDGQQPVFTVVDENGVETQFLGTLAIVDPGNPVERAVMFCNDGWLSAAYIAGPLETVAGDITSIGCQ